MPRRNETVAEMGTRLASIACALSVRVDLLVANEPIVVKRRVSAFFDTDLGTILETIESARPTMVVVDSVQSIHSADVESSPGSVSQLRECTLRQCFRVLIEERLEGPRFSTLEIFEVVSTGATRFLGAVTAMAYVDVNAQSEEMLRFAENVAVNRAFPVKVFSTVAAAERWLRADASRSITRGERADAHKPRR